MRQYFVTYGFAEGLFYKASVVNEYLDKIEKSDSRPVSKTDLPKPVEPSPVARAFPRTLQELDKHWYRSDIFPLEKAVGQLLVSGYVGNEKCRRLLLHLESLAQEFDKLRRELENIDEKLLRQADEAVAGRT